MGIPLLLASTFLLSMKGIFAKLAYAEGAGVDATLFYRFLMSLPIVWGFLLYKKKMSFVRNAERSEMLFILGLSFFGYYLGSKLDYTALSLIGAGVSRIILFTYPVFVVFMTALFLKTMPTRPQILTVVLTQIGLFCVLGGVNIDVLGLNAKGALFALGSALVYAFYILLLSIKGKGIDSQYLITMVVSFAFVFMCIDVLISNPLSDLSLTPRAYFWIFIMAVFATALPLTLFAEAVKHMGGSDSAVMSSIGPVFTMVVSYFALDEHYMPVQIFGALVILFSIYYLNRASKGKIKAP